MPPPISIQELYQMKNKQHQKVKQRFQKVIELLHQRIRAAAKQSRMHCIYEIPIFLPGMALYDRTECMNFVVENMRKTGFHVGRPKQPTTPWELYISWDPDEIDGPMAAPGGSGGVAAVGTGPKTPKFISFLGPGSS